ncbi:hypothetical protein ESCAB7627_1643 [Escherichia albertii TW07627]|uniref:LysR family transcriptional regulator n=1 Tax=Escherichia albertii (strain TW07627) TaxID=502347 RepID=A0ABC9NRU1_ESCAT|nr:hypothetical protein EAKF1_ch3746 [Escherichia albertii KF1]EDS92899.1 hypothetical protein ESCAB7627_1643 [Escherichia albertii TW07627]
MNAKFEMIIDLDYLLFFLTMSQNLMTARIYTTYVRDAMLIM